MLKAFTRGCTKVVEKYLPDAYLFAIILTAVCFVLCLILTDAGLMGTLMAWGGGIWNLLAFTCQMATIMVFGYALAKGVREAIEEKGFLGIFTGGLGACAGGIAAAIICGLLVSLLFKPKDKS